MASPSFNTNFNTGFNPYSWQQVPPQQQQYPEFPFAGSPSAVNLDIASAAPTAAPASTETAPKASAYPEFNKAAAKESFPAAPAFTLKKYAQECREKAKLADRVAGLQDI